MIGPHSWAGDLEYSKLRKNTRFIFSQVIKILHDLVTALGVAQDQK